MKFRTKKNQHEKIFVYERATNFTNTDKIKHEIDRLASMLTFYGYLSPVATVDEYCVLRAGNEELKRFYRSKLNELLERRLERPNGYSSGGDVRTRTVDFLLTGRTKLFEESLNGALLVSLNNTRVQDGDSLLDFYTVILKNLLTSPINRVNDLPPPIDSELLDRSTFARLMVEPSVERYDTAIIVGINTVSISDTKRLDIPSKFANESKRTAEDRLSSANDFVKHIRKVCVTCDNYNVIAQ